MQDLYLDITASEEYQAVSGIYDSKELHSDSRGRCLTKTDFLRSVPLIRNLIFLPVSFKGRGFGVRGVSK